MSGRSISGKIAWWVSAIALVTGLAQNANAGGAWVPKKGDGYISLGFSQKTANKVWDAKGKDFITRNGAGLAHYHDFRYAYLTGEVGVLPRTSVTFLTTYLWGFEGYKTPGYEKNFGLSDAWIGAKFRLRSLETAWPVAVRVTVRTPFFYDQDGPYVRHLYNREPYRLPNGTVDPDTTFLVINNPEWRGLNRHDVTIAPMISHSFTMFKGWTNLDIGFTWRQGAPANEIPINWDMGYGLPIQSADIYIKAATNMVFAIGNKSISDPSDRFNFPPGFRYDFNKASMIRAAVSVLWSFKGNYLEAGYGQWVWGRGARQYKEPFFNIGHGF